MDPRKPIDLNRPPAGHPEQRDHGCASRAVEVEVVFRNHRKKLLGLLNEAEQQGWVCFGSMAWFTDPLVLAAIARTPASIIVQKEDHLRPDIPVGRNLAAWRERLRRMYEAIEASDQQGDPAVPFDRLHMPWPLCDMSYGEDKSVAGVRCFGVRNDRSGKTTSRPLMHHKFFVFAKGIWQPEPGREGEENPDQEFHWHPEVVWTGSYNCSLLAPRSRENALIIRDANIGSAYLHEWAEIMALSEPLDWDSEWLAPEWRLGT